MSHLNKQIASSKNPQNGINWLKRSAKTIETNREKEVVLNRQWPKYFVLFKSGCTLNWIFFSSTCFSRFPMEVFLCEVTSLHCHVCTQKSPFRLPIQGPPILATVASKCTYLLKHVPKNLSLFKLFVALHSFPEKHKI